MSESPQHFEYEQQAAAEIEAWKRSGPSRFARATGLAFAPLNAPVNKVLQNPRAQQVVQSAMEKALDASSWSVPKTGVIQGYAAMGYEIRSLSSIPGAVPLRVADERVGGARLRHIGSAAGIGTAGGLGVVAAAGTGTAAAPTSGGTSIPGGLAAALGIAGAEIVTTTGLLCRMVSLTAAHYGFDTAELAERDYALQVLNTALADSNEDKFAALASIATLRNQLIRMKQPWSELEGNALAASIKKAGEKFGRSITQAQLRRIVSVLGVAVGGGFNAFQMRDVARTAYFMYRERYLLAKQGPD